MKTTAAFLISSMFWVRFCSNTSEPTQSLHEFKIKVDSIQIPTSVKVADTVAVKFFGTIGSGCAEFLRFEDLTQEMTVNITAWGYIRDRGGSCPDWMVYLDGRRYTFIATKAGQETLIIHQPDGSIMQRFIQVL